MKLISIVLSALALLVVAVSPSLANQSSHATFSVAKGPPGPDGQAKKARWTREAKLDVKRRARSVAKYKCKAEDDHAAPDWSNPGAGTTVPTTARYICHHIYLPFNLLGWRLAPRCKWLKEDSMLIAECYPEARLKLYKRKPDSEHPMWKVYATSLTGGVRYQFFPKAGMSIQISAPLWDEFFEG